MNRYFLNASACCDNQTAEMDVADNGDYYRVEDVDPIIADRDIKAANLQKLVEKVLTYNNVREGVVSTSDIYVDVLEAQRLLSELVELARGLKQ